MEDTRDPLVGVIMGSQSDWPTMKKAVEILKEFNIPHEVNIVSAHRTPHRLTSYATSLRERDLKVIIAGAGGAAHLPGMVAAQTILPVLGVPIKTSTLNGVDSLYSIVQMPAGVPVLTLAIGDAGAKNAALAAVSILATSDEKLSEKLYLWRVAQTNGVAERPTDEPPKS